MKKFLTILTLLCAAVALAAQSPTLPTPDDLLTQEAALESLSPAKVAKLALIKAEIVDYRATTSDLAAALTQLSQANSDLLAAQAVVTAVQATQTTALAAQVAMLAKATSQSAQIVADIQAASQMSQNVPLLNPSNLVYRGACRLPAGFDYAAPGSTWSAERGSLYLFGDSTLAGGPSVYEVTCQPHLGTLTSLPFVTIKANAGVLFDPSLVGPQSGMTGLLATPSRLIAAATVTYDALNQACCSHYARGKTGATLGPVQVGQVYGWMGGGKNAAGFISGYMTLIPAMWQAALGGNMLAGNCCLSIISRTNLGAGVAVLDHTQIGTVSPVPVTHLLAQPSSHPTISVWSNTIGIKGAVVYDATSVVHGVVLPDHTRSLLFFGTQGVGMMCYGPGTANAALIGTPTGTSDPWCLDPGNGSKGQHAYPYIPQVWAYDVLDLVEVAQGKVQPWDVSPYNVWPLTLPSITSQYRMISILGAAIDQQAQLIYLTVAFQDGDRPLIHVFQLVP